MWKKLGAIVIAVFAIPGTLVAQEVNVYSARHYDTDDTIYQKFTRATGIKVNLIEGNSDALFKF